MAYGHSSYIRFFSFTLIKKEKIMTIVVPTLSTFSWVKSPAESVDFLLSHMFHADKFQTCLYGDNVTSMPWILEEASGSTDKAVLAVRQAIITYLSRYYDSVQANVSVTEEDPTTSSSKMRMSLDIRLIKSGVEYQVSRLISLIDGRFKEFINLNNSST
jgi:hypothetical protein